jgi:hypothetical protein
MLSRTLGPKKNKITEDWRKLRNEEINNLYSLPNIRVAKSKRMGETRSTAHMKLMRDAYKILAGKSRGGGGKNPV